MFRFIAAAFLSLTLPQSFASRLPDTYTAVVVEYPGLFSDNRHLQQVLQLNLHNYETLLDHIGNSVNHPDIVVFPESVLFYIGRILSSSDYYSVATEVPDASDAIAPCDNNGRYSDVLIRLSCVARKLRVYLVVNLVEKAICNGSPECKVGNWNLYNTNVAYDRTGIVVARYRKYNLFEEYNINQPLHPEAVTFETDFGVTFGIFTCFDIMFEEPAISLVRKGIKHIIFPTLWFSEYPFLTALQAQDQWSRAHNVTLLAAGGNYPSFGSGGSGIYHGANGALVYDIIMNGRSKFYTAEIGVTKESISVPGSAFEMDKFQLLRDNLSEYASVVMDSNKVHTTVCSGSFCCEFDISSSVNLLSIIEYQYHLLAYSGVRTFSGVANGGIETCALVACRGPSLQSCEAQFPQYEEVSWPRTFSRISVKANYSVDSYKSQYPNSLLSDLRPLPASASAWTHTIYKEAGFIEREHRLLVPQNRLYTFGIFGRDHSRDSTP